MPMLAAAAVNRIGRRRCSVASTTASQGDEPCATKASIWVTRITELRMMMPISARMPRIATKPIGVPVGTSASTTPIRPSGATLATRNIFCTLCNWIIRKVAIRNTINGTTWLIGPWALALSSTVPPVATL
ncbi:hypothetical protein D3C84_900950 [compost metagenome]